MDATQVADMLGAMAAMGVAAVVLAGVVAIIDAPGRASLRSLVDEHGRISAWLVAVIATAGSLWFSESAGFPPCELCWYQRIAMYPLVVVCGVGAATRDLGSWRYGVPLAAIGLVIAAYHVALQFQPSLDVVSCDVGAPCTGRYVLVFGFISIPTLAGAAFLLILGLLVTSRTVSRDISDD